MKEDSPLIKVRKTIIKPGKFTNLFDALACPYCMRPNLYRIKFASIDREYREYSNYGEPFENLKKPYFTDRWNSDCTYNDYIETDEEFFICDECGQDLPEELSKRLLEWDNFYMDIDSYTEKRYPNVF